MSERSDAGAARQVAPLDAALMRFVDARCGTALGDVRPAPDLRL